MATIINLGSVTNGTLVNNEWVGTGAFDTLIAAVNKNIELQYQKGRLTGNDYAQVYLGGMQAVLQQAINYAMNVANSQAQADLTYAQVEGVYAENMLKAKELEIKEQQLYLAQKELEIKEQMLQEELYKNGVLLPDQHNENVAKKAMIEEQTRGAYAERIIKDKEAAKLGLDNVVKNAEATRTTNNNAVYTPKYVGA